MIYFSKHHSNIKQIIPFTHKMEGDKFAFTAWNQDSAPQVVVDMSIVELTQLGSIQTLCEQKVKIVGKEIKVCEGKLKINTIYPMMLLEIFPSKIPLILNETKMCL